EGNLERLAFELDCPDLFGAALDVLELAPPRSRGRRGRTPVGGCDANGWVVIHDGITGELLGVFPNHGCVLLDKSRLAPDTLFTPGDEAIILVGLLRFAGIDLDPQADLSLMGPSGP